MKTIKMVLTVTALLGVLGGTLIAGSMWLRMEPLVDGKIKAHADTSKELWQTSQKSVIDSLERIETGQKALVKEVKDIREDVITLRVKSENQ